MVQEALFPSGFREAITSGHAGVHPAKGQYKEVFTPNKIKRGTMTYT